MPVKRLKKKEEKNGEFSREARNCINFTDINVLGTDPKT